MYKRVNKLFAEAVLDEIGSKKAFIFIQDYHLALLSRLIKARNHDVITAQFWHIPWPNPEAFRICPWQNEILNGLLGNDLLGFHIPYHRTNFLETVDRTLECKIDHNGYSVTRSGRTTFVMPFPISVDFERISSEAASADVSQEIERIRDRWRLTDEFIGVGIDRIDYTKGIPERLKAIDRLLSKYPQYQRKLVFFQIGEPSRIQITRYRELNAEVDGLIEEINWKHQSHDWKPIVYIKEHKTPATLLALNRMANFCIVSSLHDGMNLVAKEYVASRITNDGVLILSQFTGASRELTDALMVNPYATYDLAETIKEAIEMPKDKQRERMIKLRSVVQDNNIYRWAGEIISELVRLGEA